MLARRPALRHRAAKMAGPVRLATVPRDEAVSLNSLIQTDNKLFNKVILIFAYLCDQVEILKQQAQAHFYAPLLLLAEGEDLGGEGEAPQARSRLPPSVATRLQHSQARHLSDALTRAAAPLARAATQSSRLRPILRLLARQRILLDVDARRRVRLHSRRLRTLSGIPSAVHGRLVAPDQGWQDQRPGRPRE